MYRSLDKAIQFVDHMHTTSKGKSNLEKCQFGYTSYASCVAQLKQVHGNYLHTPTKAQQAGECLKRHGLIEEMFL